MSPNAARILLKSVILASRVDHDLILYVPPSSPVEDPSAVILSLQAANDTQTACLVVEFKRNFASQITRRRGFGVVRGHDELLGTLPCRMLAHTFQCVAAVHLVEVELTLDELKCTLLFRSEHGILVEHRLRLNEGSRVSYVASEQVICSSDSVSSLSCSSERLNVVLMPFAQGGHPSSVAASTYVSVSRPCNAQEITFSSERGNAQATAAADVDGHHLHIGLKESVLPLGQLSASNLAPDDIAFSISLPELLALVGAFLSEGSLKGKTGPLQIFFAPEAAVSVKCHGPSGIDYGAFDVTLLLSTENGDQLDLEPREQPLGRRHPAPRFPQARVRSPATSGPSTTTRIASSSPRSPPASTRQDESVAGSSQMSFGAPVSPAQGIKRHNSNPPPHEENMPDEVEVVKEEDHATLSQGNKGDDGAENLEDLRHLLYGVDDTAANDMHGEQESWADLLRAISQDDDGAAEDPRQARDHAVFNFDQMW
ncbi:hypothetical protein FOL47_002835 [Perkinsus chesapeaki]|uniref:Cell cycle checkpoint control protein RAD9A n=1 Tax=Perkinsus chesapeaki TaxID=330153 RepID=A0A7J6MBC3_PERCH|nr:hypothetical protein FOL47_002835 [Perkinsus chesapeaki]